MLLVLDNYDSFTYNVSRYFEELGQTVRVYKNDELSVEEFANLKPEYLVLSPGPGRPEGAGCSLQLIERLQGVCPILGVCLGMQCIAQHFGAEVRRAAKVMHGKTSQVTHNNQGLFAGLEQPLQVARYHSLVVAGRSLPPELKVSAEVAGDEHNEVMAIAHISLPIVGVQFHPEAVQSAQGHELFKNFLNMR